MAAANVFRPWIDIASGPVPATFWIPFCDDFELAEGDVEEWPTMSQVANAAARAIAMTAPEADARNTYELADFGFQYGFRAHGIELLLLKGFDSDQERRTRRACTQRWVDGGEYALHWRGSSAVTRKLGASTI